MLNIQNFKLVEPTAMQLRQYKNTKGKVPYFLQSEDGQDWYECQKLFAHDTVKIMYGSDGIIRSVVDAPVPERGNIYAVSMLFPLNMSVAEVDQENYPDGCDINGTWKFDGERVYQDVSLFNAEILRRNVADRNTLCHWAVMMLSTIQSSAAVGNPRDEDAENLLALQQYLDALRGVDLTQINPDWPVKPGCLAE